MIVLTSQIRMELLFILLFRYMRKVKEKQVQKLIDVAAEGGVKARPVANKTVKKVKKVLPVLAK